MFLQKAITFSPCRTHLDKIAVFGVRCFSSVVEEGTADANKPAQPLLFKKQSKVMKAYVERSKAYNEFMKKEEQAYNIGKRHLANMMGVDPETFTQKDVDEAIEYLFPSGIFDKRGRPFMKPPQDVFPPRKDAQFDETGRPFHFLFYTGKSNFYEILHETVSRLNELNSMEDALVKSRKTIKPTEFDLSGSRWLSKSELETLVVESLTVYEYKNYVNALERLVSHSLSYTQKDFIMKQRKILLDVTKSYAVAEPQEGPDGRLYVTTQECPRKSARATVTVIKPGTGKIEINNKGIDFYSTIQARNQILFPLELTGLRDRVDVVAAVVGGGETGQAGAVRYGIAWGLRSFVSQDMVESMRLAGLLTKDFRNRERKKPGQEGARRKFTWKKR
uniref:Small ribosomal subunit protein uS9m n=1 Tax=Lygus hesperus TaxID=30085 RepID=A0A146LSR9_LYGHE